LEGVLDADEHPFRLLAELGGGVLVAAACLARLFPNVFFISPSVPWSTFVGRLLVGAIASYPVLAVCYAAAATVFIGARGSLGERNAPLTIALLALWLPLWTLPLSAAVFTWRRSVHIRLLGACDAG
jgi:TRAP-type C4-dicarboxylate transport system permease large subunit